MLHITPVCFGQTGIRQGVKVGLRLWNLDPTQSLEVGPGTY